MAGQNREQRPPHYPCNSDPQAVEALPTLVSYPASNNFRDDKAGVLWDHRLQAKTEPNPDERERLLGYDTGITAAPGLTEADRFQLTGQCMDANQMRAIFHTALALDDALPSLLQSTLRPYEDPPRAPAEVASLPA